MLPLVFALGGFFMAVWGLKWGSVGVWDILHEIPCKPSFILVGASGGVAFMEGALAGGWIEPALDGGSIFDAAILAFSAMAYAGGEGVS